jgi:hypothetical protein
LNLSIATGRDLNTAVELLGATMNIFGLGVGDSERLMNLFSAAQFTSAASVDDLNQAMRYAGPIFKSSNQSIETTVTALAMLKNKGLEATQAGTTLRTALAQLYKETDKGSAVLAKYGLTYDDVNPSTQDFSDIIEKLSKPGGPVFSAKDAIDLFGKRAFIMDQIITEGADSFREYRETITDTELGFDALEKKMAKFDVVMNNLGGSMDIMKKTFGIDLVSAITDFIGTDENSGIRLGITKLQELELESKEISGVLLEVFGNLREHAGDTFKELFPTWEDFYDYIVDIAKALGTNLQVLGVWAIDFAAAFVKMTQDTDNLKFALYTVNEAFALLSLAVALPRDAIVFTFALIENGIKLILDGFGWIEEKAYSMMLSIQTALSKLPFTDITEQELETLRLKLEEIKEGNKDAFNLEWPDSWSKGVMSAYEEAHKGINEFGGDYKSVMFDASEDTKALTDSTSKWATTWGEAAQGIQDDFTGINKEIETFHKEIKDSSSELGDSAKMAEQLAEAVKESTYEMKEFSETTSGVKGGLTVITNEAEKLPAIIDDTVSREDALTMSMKETEDGVLQIGVGLDKVRGDVSLASDGTLIWANRGKDVKDITEQIGTDISKMSKEELKIFTEKFKADLKMTELTTKQTHELVKANLEWQAKIDIAQIEADAKKVVAAFETIGASVVATAEATASMFGGLLTLIGEGDLFPSEIERLYGLVERQLSVQESLAAAQVELTREQAENMRLQNDRIKKGDPAISIAVTVQGDVEGWLAGLMESLFNEIMTKASAEGFKALAQG